MSILLRFKNWLIRFYQIAMLNISTLIGLFRVIIIIISVSNLAAFSTWNSPSESVNQVKINMDAKFCEKCASACHAGIHDWAAEFD